MKINLTSVTFGDEEIAEALDSLKSGFVTMGDKCRRFEHAFSELHHGLPAVFVNSGSSANLLATFAAANPDYHARKGGIRPGSEVIVPAVAWSTSIWPVVQAGAIPVLVDCDSDTLSIIPQEIEKAIGSNTKAIVLVHPLGNICDMNAIVDICERHSLTLIEDTCEALGSVYENRMAGSFGDFGTYSFYFSHHLTTIEGGMVICRDEEDAKLLRVMRAHGWSRETQSAAKLPFDKRYEFINTGFNLRPSDINGAFGLHQIKKLGTFKAARETVVKGLLNGLADLIDGGKVRPMRINKNVRASYFGFPILCNSKDERDRLSDHLEGDGIETRPIICGNMARQPAMKMIEHRISGTLSGADEIMDCGIYWGVHPHMDDKQIDYIAQSMNRFEWA